MIVLSGGPVRSHLGTGLALARDAGHLVRFRVTNDHDAGGAHGASQECAARTDLHWNASAASFVRPSDLFLLRLGFAALRHLQGSS